MKADGHALDQADVFRSLPDRGFEAGEAGRAGLTTGDLVVAVGPEGGPDTVYEGGDDGVPWAARILEGREIIYNRSHIATFSCAAMFQQFTK
jgi:hypothetical protein